MSGAWSAESRREGMTDEELGRHRKRICSRIHLDWERGGEKHHVLAYEAAQQLDWITFLGKERKGKSEPSP